MATLKTANTTGKYHDPNSIPDVIAYIMNPAKAIHQYIGFVGIDPNHIVFAMKNVALTYQKTNGVQLRHFILSFPPAELQNPAVAFQIGAEVADYLGREYQVAYAVHEDKPHIHIHIVINAVSYIDGHRYSGKKKPFYQLMNATSSILQKYGIIRLKYVSNTRRYQG